MSIRNFIHSTLGLDFHVSRVLISRSWSILAGLVLLAFLPLWFNEVEQGYYFTFNSLLAMQIFFELGMNQVIIQFTGHEAAHLSYNDKEGFKGSKKNLDRLASFVKLLRKWYLVASLLFFLIIGLFGMFFFQANDDLYEVNWFWPWFCLVAATSANIYLTAILGIMEGLGKIGDVAELRLAQSFVGYSLMWIALSSGFGLFSVCIVPFTAVIFSAIWINRKGHAFQFLKKFYLDQKSIQVNWMKEIFPFQWRLAISWISGYISLQIIPLLLFENQGAIESGRVGLAVSIFVVLNSVSLAWISTKLPRMTSFISHGKRQDLNELFMFAYKRTFIFFLIVCVLILFLVYSNQSFNIYPTERIPSLGIFFCLVIASLANNFIYSAAIYLRAHKEEPILVASIVCGMATLISSYFSSFVSSFLVMFMYALIMLFLLMPWTLIIFLRYFKRTG